MKKPKASNKSTPIKKGGGGGAKKPSATPTEKDSKRGIKSISDFFGAAPVKRTTRSSRQDKGNEISKRPVQLGKRQAQDDGVGGTDLEVSTVPESPTEAILMEFSDEAVALALQEEELEMQERVRMPPTCTCTCVLFKF